MKKRITMALGLMMILLMLCACGTDPASVDYNGHSYTELQTEIYENANAVAQLASFYKQNGITEADLTQDFREMFITNYGFTDEQLTAAIIWMNVQDEFGEVVSVDEESFQVAKAGKTLTTDLTLEFEKRNVTFQVVYAYYSMEITGFTIEPVYSLSEKMAKAGMNTVISISIVFSVLIVISLVIACFNIFPYLDKKKAAKNPVVSYEAAKFPAVLPDAVPVEPAADDTELIAVIAAAIAASTGTSTSDFVVRSINRR